MSHLHEKQTARQVSALASSNKEKRTGNGLNSTTECTTPAAPRQASPKLSQKWIQYYAELERRYEQSQHLSISQHRQRLAANVLLLRGERRGEVQP